MASQVVTYRTDASTEVRFEIDPTADFQPVGHEHVIGRVRDAVEPAIEAAKVVLEKIKEVRPDEIEVKFGIKVSGKADWLVAKIATEGNFEITLTWKPPMTQGVKPAIET
jgi:hypothetical protein